MKKKLRLLLSGKNGRTTRRFLSARDGMPGRSRFYAMSPERGGLVLMQATVVISQNARYRALTFATLATFVRALPSVLQRLSGVLQRHCAGSAALGIVTALLNRKPDEPALGIVTRLCPDCKTASTRRGGRCSACRKARRAMQCNARNHAKGITEVGSPEFHDKRSIASKASYRGELQNYRFNQPGPNHQLAVTFWVRDPRRREWRVRNIQHFVKQHPELFDPRDIAIVNRCGKTLASGGLSRIHTGVRGSWKGWTAISQYERRFKTHHDIPARNRLGIGALLNAEKSDEPALGIVTALLNRKPDGKFEFPADDWYLIATKGEHPHAETGLVQVVDDTSVQAMVNAFQPGEELLVDFDHESWDNKKRTTAAGWIQNVKSAAQGLMAQIRWSGSGKTALANGDYRFISPVWLGKDVEQIDKNRIRPLRLNDAGITNRPNLSGLPPMTNRELDARPQHAADSADQQQKESMKKLNVELGLSADASEESAIAEVTKLKNRASEAEGKLQPLTAENTTLKNSNRGLLSAQVESDLDTAGLEGEERDTFKTQLLANRDGALPLLAALSKAKGNATANALTNRSGAKTPGDKKSASGADDQTQEQKINDAVANAKGETFEQRFENARRSNPDLFKPEAAE